MCVKYPCQQGVSFVCILPALLLYRVPGALPADPAAPSAVNCRTGLGRFALWCKLRHVILAFDPRPAEHGTEARWWFKTRSQGVALSNRCQTGRGREVSIAHLPLLNQSLFLNVYQGSFASDRVSPHQVVSTVNCPHGPQSAAHTRSGAAGAACRFHVDCSRDGSVSSAIRLRHGARPA
jgi:hypothetical protein